MFEWLTLFPTRRPLLQTVHTFAMVNSERWERLPRLSTACKWFTTVSLLVAVGQAAGCSACRPPSAAVAVGPAVDLPHRSHALISGRVIDGDEQVVEGARVIGRGKNDERALAVTDRDGHFALRLPEGQAELLIEWDKALPERFETNVPADGIEVALRRRVTIEGIVLWNDKPVIGAQVSLMAGARFSANTTTGPTGRFQFAELGEARYALRVLAAPGVAYLSEVQTDGKALRLALEPARTVMVKIVDDQGKPVEGELLLSETEGPAAPRKVKVPGKITLRSAVYRVEARIRDHLPLVTTWTVGGSGGEEIFAVTRPSRLLVEVIGEAGRPLSKAQISLGRESESRSGGGLGQEDPRLLQLGELGVLRGPIPFPPVAPLLAVPAEALRSTSSSGELELVDLSPGKTIVQVSHPDYLSTICNIELTPGVRSKLRCALKRGEALSGRVVDEEGRPIAGARVTWQEGQNRQMGTVTDGGGRFSLRASTVPLTLLASATGWASRSVSGQGNEISIALQPARDRISGLVEDERGRVIAGAEIRVGERRVVSDARGQFSLDGIGRPPQPIEIRHPEFAPLRVVFAGGEAGAMQRYVLPFGGGIEGRVVTAGPEALAGKVSIEVRGGGVAEMVKLLDDGSFRRAGLPAGRATVRIIAEGFVAAARTIEILPGDSFGEITVRDVDFRLEAAMRLIGRVRRSDGLPANGARVVAGGQTTTPNADGEFIFPGLLPGGVVVSASQGGEEAEASVEGRPGETLNVELDLR